MKTAPESRRKAPAPRTLPSGIAMLRHDQCVTALVEQRNRFVEAPLVQRVGWRLVVPMLLACSAGVAAAADTVAGCGSPLVEVGVSFAPGTVLIDDSKPSRALEKTGGKLAALHQLGVTRATPQRVVRVQLNEREPGACPRARVTLQLSVRPLVVELAAELKQNDCLRAYVLEHEMQHVAIYNAATSRAAVQLEQEMRAQWSASRSRGTRDNVHDLQTQVNDQWLPRLDALVAAADVEQEALDVDQERQAYRACNGEMAQFSTTIR
jgi:hypothetical protein